jgi:Ca-activated chloride channel family protein
VIFLTDGLPTEGETDTDRILSNFADDAPDNVRLFAFGVGYDVDTFLLDLLAGNHHGTSSYVVPGERIDEKVSAFYQKIQTPVMTDLELEVDGVTLFDGYPTPLPDLFVGSQIILVGRYRDGGSADITLRGVIDGETQSFVFPDQHFATGFERRPESQSLQAVPRLWATRKIGYLLNQIRLHGPDEETIDQVVRLSIRFGIVTPYTSYLVTEDMKLGEEALDGMAAEELEQMMEAPAPESSGESAVERSSDQNALEEADSASGVPVTAAEQVRVLGSRTYVNLDGVWVDTAFDPDTMTTVKVPFLSDDYFDLAAARPELAAAFSLGTRVIAFSGGEVFEVVAEGEPGDPVDVEPQQLDPEDPFDPSEPGDPGDSGDPSEDGQGTGFPCLGGVLPLIVILPLGFLGRRRR